MRVQLLNQLIYADQTKQIIGLLFQTRNDLGSGWSEEHYHKLLVARLMEAGIPTQSKPRYELKHRNTHIHTFEPDLIVWDKIILELKVLFSHQGKNFPSTNQRQILHYLSYLKMNLGLLVNFAHPMVGFKRMAFTSTKSILQENYQEMLPYLNMPNRKLLRQVREIIIQIVNMYGLGLPETAYRKLIITELAYQNIDCTNSFAIPVKVDDLNLGCYTPTSCLLIHNQFILNISTNFKGAPEAQYLNTKSYLNQFGLKVGWVVNFGRANLQINAVLAK